MCNLSQGIKEQAYVEGTENGIAIGKQEGITIGKREGIAETIVKMLMLLPIEVPIPAAISRAASYSIEFGTRIPRCPSASYTSSSTGNSVPLYSTVSTRMSIRSPGCVYRRSIPSLGE